jgi:hypothetical protein
MDLGVDSCDTPGSVGIHWGGGCARRANPSRIIGAGLALLLQKRDFIESTGVAIPPGQPLPRR